MYLTVIKETTTSNLMNTHIKYPSTPHISKSESITLDDIMGDASILSGKRIIITEKRDGENTTMYSDHIHARSLDSNNHPSRNYVKGMWATIRYMIPNGYRICGENLYAKHSIYYDSLDSYFEAFNVWDGDVCLDWDSTVEFVTGLGIITVPILYDGIFDERIISDIINSLDTSIQEGVVIRNADSFKHNEFSQNVFKWVRKNHVQTDQHWMMQKIVPNSLKKI